jgi:NitT/TauT family transport system permease protein
VDSAVLVPDFIVVAWDLTIRLFRIPPYQIPAPGDVVVVLWQRLAELMRQAWPDHLCDDLRLPAVGGVRHSRRDADRGSKTVESYVYPLLVFSQSVPRSRSRRCLWLVRLRHHPESDLGVPAWILSGGGLGGAGVQIGRPRHGRSGARDAGQPLQGVLARQPAARDAGDFSGLKVSVTLAVVGAVVGEFVGSNSGIGYVLQRSIGTFDLPTMFAALVILALLGVILFWIVDRIERLVIPWHVSQRDDFIFAA